MLHNQWLRARKNLLAQIRSQVSRLSGPMPLDLKNYSDAYNEEFKTSWRPTSREAFAKDLSTRHIVLGGDFHAYAQSQRLHLRILRELKRPVVLGLECIETKSQRSLDAFQKGQIGEEEFLRKVRWASRWGFPWQNYKPLFDWARLNQVPVVALNRHEDKKTSAGFKRRDAHAAQQIQSLSKKYPKHLIYVIFGDLHMARPHLPKALSKAFGYDPKPLVLFQNSEKLYFRVARKGQEAEVEWLTSSHGRYCHLSSPPWVKWQSYLNYLEQSFDQDLEEHEGELELTDQVGAMVSFLSQDLGLKVAPKNLAVYSPGQSSFESVLQRVLKPDHRKVASCLIQSERSFFLPREGIAYLSRYSINHAAALAGQFIHSQLSGHKTLFWDQPKEFTQMIWVEAVGFYFSKLVNHSRKAENLKTLRARLFDDRLKQDQPELREALELALEQRLREVIYARTGRLRVPRAKKFKTQVYLEAARILGEILGDQLYLSYRKGRLKAPLLIKLFKINPGLKSFSKSYFDLVTRLENSSRPEPSGERLLV